MSATPVPLPPGTVPPGVPAWLSSDAESWVRARPAPWARPRWAVLALLGSLVWAIPAGADPLCSEAAPCGPDWGGMTQTGLAVVLLYWLARLPELVLVAAPALVAMVASSELPGAGPGPLAANTAVLVALAFGWASAVARLAARRGQRRLAERAAGAEHRRRGPAGPLGRGGVSIGVGLLLCALAAASVAMGLRGVRADEAHAARATRVTGRVIHRGEDSIRLRTAAARPLTVDALYPEDYAVGSTVTVLRDGSWRRLASEPYDAMGWQLLTLAAALPGISLLATGVLSRHRAANLRRTPVPALRVLQHTEPTGVMRVYAADDLAGRTPLLQCSVVPVPDCPAAVSPHPFDLDDPDHSGQFLRLVPRMREAVMLGAPYDSAELCFDTTGRYAAPLRLITFVPVGPPRGNTSDLPLLAGAERNPDPDPHAGVGRTAVGPADPDSPREPMRWGPGPVARTAGLVLMAAMTAAFVSQVTRSLSTDGFGWKATVLLGMVPVTHMAATLLGWRVTADSTGVWLNGPWRLRHVPWDRLRGVTQTKDGTVEIRLPGGESWEIVPGWPAAERRLGLNPPYARMAEEITAMYRHPDLRPVCPSHSQDRGRPMGPLLLLGAVVILVLNVLG